jgi:hypothetical protein
MSPKKRIRFTLRSSPKKRFLVGESLRFSWADLYLAMSLLVNRVRNKTLKIVLASCLSNGKGITHEYLWKLLEMLKREKALDVDDQMKVCAWVIAAYGYMHGLSTGDSGKCFPHPAPLERTKYRRIPDWREKLYCPVCNRNYHPRKNRVRKEVILADFGTWLAKHLKSEHH